MSCKYNDNIFCNRDKSKCDECSVDMAVQSYIDESVEQLEKISEPVRPVGWSRKMEIVCTKDVIEILRRGENETGCKD